MIGQIKTVFQLLLVVLVIGAFSTVSQAQDASKQLASESVLETIKKRGKLRAGVSTFVPWVMRSKSGDMIGFEIDVAKKIAADMEKLSKRQIWPGVEKQFIKLEALGISIEYEHYLIGAQSAQEIGNIYVALQRLQHSRAIKKRRDWDREKARILSKNK